MGEINPLSCLVVAALLSTAVVSGLPPDVVTLRHSYVAAEDTPPGSVLFMFTARYSDNHKAVVVTAAYNRYVSVQRVTESDSVWNVILNKPLDREDVDRIALTFILQGDSSLDVHSMLLVTDVNDNPPKFDRSVYAADVNKNTTVGTIVFADIHTTDPDTGTGGVVFYQLVPVGSDTHDIFVINSTSGSVVLNRVLDFQTTNLFHYIVTATDGGGLRSKADLYFAILGVQNTLPLNTVHAHDNTTTATHGDKTQSYDNRITYSLSSSSNPPGLAGHFHIDPLTGDVTVVQALDFDSITFSAGHPGVITLTAVAKDHGSVSLSSTKDITVILVDINDHTPQFEAIEYLTDVPESISIGSQLIGVRAQDGDGGAPTITCSTSWRLAAWTSSQSIT